MSELDAVLDAFIKSKLDIIKDAASPEEKNELIASLHEQKKQKIINEIKEQCKSEIISKANIEIQQKVHRQKLDEIKSLMRNGFVLAFIVGLAVNQVTDLFGMWKGTVGIEYLGKTVLFSIILLLVCLVAYGMSFIKHAIDFIDDAKKDKDK